MTDLRRSLEMRAALSLARFALQQGDTDGALERLSPKALTLLISKRRGCCWRNQT